MSNRTLLLTPAILTAALLAGCDEPGSVFEPPPPTWETTETTLDHWEQGRPVPFDTVEQRQGVWASPVAFLCGSDDEWHSVMEKLQEEGAFAVLPPPPPPAIDWRAGRGVLLVSAGVLRSGPARVTILETRRHGNRLLVRARREQGNIQYFTYPYHLVELERGNVKSVTVAWQ